MAGTVTLTLNLLARDGVSPVLAKVGGETSALATRLKTAGTSLSSAGSKLTTSLTLPLVLAGGASAKLASDFSSAMARIHTQAGGSAKDVKVLSGQVLDLAKSTQQGPVELADALYHLKSVGLANVPAMRALGAASKFAAVGGADLEETTNAVAGAWRSGIRGAGSFRQAVANLNAIVGAGNMRMSDLNDAMGTGFLASARTFGVSLRQAGSALAVMTDEGIPANAAATRLRMSFSLLAAPSDAANKALKTIGLTGHQLGETMQQPGGLLKSLDLLKEKLKGSGEDAAEQASTLSHAFGGGRSSSAILTLLNNLDVVHQKFSQISGSAKNFGTSVATQSKTAAAQFAQFKASVEVAAVKFGNLLLPVLVKVANALGDFADWLSNLNPNAQKLALVVAGVAAAAGPLLLIVGGLVTAIGALISPVGLIVAGLIAAGAAFLYAYKHSESFRNGVNSALTQVKSTIRSFVAFATAFWDRFGSTIERVAKVYFGGVLTTIRGVLKIIQGVLDVFTGILTGNWRQAWNGIKEIVSGVWNTIKGSVQTALAGIIGVVGNKLGDVVGFFRRLPGRMLDAMGNLAGDMYTLGKEAITGLLHGIVSMAESVKNAVVDIAKNSVTGAFKGAMSILSPSKVMHALGVNVVEGLIQGIDSQLSAVRSKMQEVASTVQGAFTSSAFGATDVNGNPITTGRGLIESQSGILAQTKRFTHDLHTLIQDHVAKPLIAEILSTGNFAAAHSLATGPASEIARLNRLYGQTQHQEGRISDMVDRYLGYPQRQADLERQRAQDRELLKVLKELAKTKGGITFDNTFHSDDRRVRRLVHDVVEQQLRAARRSR